MEIYREKEKLRKREQHLKVRNKDHTNKSRFEINNGSGLNQRRKLKMVRVKSK